MNEVLPYIGGILGGIALIVTPIIVNRQSSKVSKNTFEIEKVKTEATSKAEVVKTQVTAETKRVDQLLEASMDLIKNLQEENRLQRKDMMGLDKTHRLELIQMKKEIQDLQRNMNICIEARSKFEMEVGKKEALYNALEQQLKSVQAFQAKQKLKGV